MKIYKITNIINNKIYIGQTSKDLKTRFYSHCRQNNCIALYSAIKKYGKENFKIEEIFSSENQNEIDHMEKKLIKDYSSNHREIGYNIKEGGLVCGVPQTIIDKMRKFHKCKDFYGKNSMGNILNFKSLCQCSSKTGISKLRIKSILNKNIENRCDWNFSYNKQDILNINVPKKEEKTYVAYNILSKETLVFNSFKDLCQKTKISSTCIKRVINKNNNFKNWFFYKNTKLINIDAYVKYIEYTFNGKRYVLFSKEDIRNHTNAPLRHIQKIFYGEMKDKYNLNIEEKKMRVLETINV